MKILVIEDNASNMKFVTTVLEMDGYETLQSDNAENGIVIAKKEMPDLILMDILLPGLDGLTASGLLKNDKKTKDIPIIAMTSLAMKDDKEKIRTAGFDHYIIKPFHYKEFLETIKNILAKSNNQIDIS